MKKPLSELRKNYSLSHLLREDLSDNPMKQFKLWLDDAMNAEILEPNAMTLSTVSSEGNPSSRVVLLKGLKENALVFYTNYESAKAQDIESNPQVCVNFLWKVIQRQVRIEGIAKKTTREESETYFQSRPKKSQIGAWASAQSSIISSRQILEDKQKDLEIKYANDSQLPLPPFWGGYEIEVKIWEFWQGRTSRLHDRFRYSLDAKNDWKIERLNP